MATNAPSRVNVAAIAFALAALPQLSLLRRVAPLIASCGSASTPVTPKLASVGPTPRTSSDLVPRPPITQPRINA